MWNSLEIYNSVDSRIRSDINHYKGELPERVAIAWRGYIASLAEWGVIDDELHSKLWKLIPDIENDPVTDILIGRE